MDCKKAKALCLEYWELDQSRQGELKSHFQLCPNCDNEFNNYCHCLGAYRGLTEPDLTEESFSTYWTALVRKLRQPSLTEKVSQGFKGILGWFNRSVWGPVPAYALATVALIAFLAVLPLVQNGQSWAANPPSFRSNLVGERFEPMRADTPGGTDTY